MKVPRYDRQLRHPNLRPLWRLVVVRALNRMLEHFGGEPMEEPTLPWYLRRRTMRLRVPQAEKSIKSL